MTKYPKVLQSSADPYSLSLTIKGILMGLVPFALFVAQSYSFTLTESQLTNIIGLLSTAVASIVTLIGLVRKLAIAINK